MSSKDTLKARNGDFGAGGGGDPAPPTHFTLSNSFSARAKFQARHARVIVDPLTLPRIVMQAMPLTALAAQLIHSTCKSSQICRTPTN